MKPVEADMSHQLHPALKVLCAFFISQIATLMRSSQSDCALENGLAASECK